MVLHNKFFIVFIFCTIILYNNINAQEKIERLRCESYTKCGYCLQQFGCVWCMNPKLDVIPSPRKNVSIAVNNCIPDILKKSFCSFKDLVDPKKYFKNIDDLDLQSKKGKIIQMKPQRVRIGLRIGDSYQLDFQYSQAENYPVDLYFITDNSFSMAPFKEKLAELGNEFTETMNKLTNNFRIGFGSFVDKRELPYVNTIPAVLNNPCPGSRDDSAEKCVSPYAFKNHLSLSNNFSQFHSEVSLAELSGNVDAPEGSLDALMQAIVCKKEIGWRQDARHFIVVATDALFHIAGDGKLGGVFETNDAKCHLTNNIYDGLSNDYPSISQLNHVAKENNINIIFALVRNAWNDFILDSYKKLSENIENLKVESLSDDFSNVINITRDNYLEIVDSVTLEAKAQENIEVKITPRCSKPKPNGCSDLHLGEVVNFTATIKPLRCDKSNNQTTLISLKPIGVNESIIIELETYCNCDCESPKHSSFIANASKCSNGAGNLVCGVCSCTGNHHGSLCECDSSTPEISNLTERCRPKPGDKLCSGLGDCVCGECKCHKNRNTNRRYWGKYCTCDDDSCDRENNVLCGGHGICSCGTCKCNAGWTGSSCICQENNATCIRRGQTDVCSSKGSCECGKCECIDNYTGKYCEDCPSCKEKCNELSGCVECKIFHMGPLQHECDVKCLDYNIRSTEESIFRDREKGEKICRILDQDNCTMIYKYKYDTANNLVVTVRNTKNCKPNLILWIIMVIVSTLLIGFLTLMTWKVITTIHDRREYAKFLNDLGNSKLNSNDNPLYKGATTTFQNPCFDTTKKEVAI